MVKQFCFFGGIRRSDVYMKGGMCDILVQKQCREAVMRIRRAEERDIPRIQELLLQVGAVHAEGRPDLFKAGGTKYTAEQLKEILRDETRPVFVAVDGDDVVSGYAFCVDMTHPDDNLLTPRAHSVHRRHLCGRKGARKGRRQGGLRICACMGEGRRILQSHAQRMELQSRGDEILSRDGAYALQGGHGRAACRISFGTVAPRLRARFLHLRKRG